VGRVDANRNIGYVLGEPGETRLARSSSIGELALDLVQRSLHGHDVTVQEPDLRVTHANHGKCLADNGVSSALDEKRRFAWKAGAGVSRVGALSTGAAIGIGAVAGLVLGILVSVTTDLPLAPEVGLVLGALGGWLFHREAS
jgi:hypothetical protein